MSGLAVSRLRQERKNFRKDHPVGFFARPSRNADGSTNMLKWNCGVPGKAGTIWAGGTYKVDLEFTEDFPSTPPIARFKPVIYHPNVYGSGKVCLSIIDPSKTWNAAITIKQILIGVQELLDNPNDSDAAQTTCYSTNRSAYDAKVREQAKRFPPP